MNTLIQETSREAYESVLPFLPAVRAEVYRLLFAAGANGLTDEELTMHFPDLDECTARVERRHLVKAGYVVDSGNRRKTSGDRNGRVSGRTGGRSVIVWRIK